MSQDSSWVDKRISELGRSVPLEDFVPSRASMRHVCEPLALDELEEAFNGQAMNVGIISPIEICDKLSSGFDDRLLKDCDLLVF